MQPRRSGWGLGARDLAVEIIAVFVPLVNSAGVVVDLEQGLGVTGQVVVVDEEGQTTEVVTTRLLRLGNAIPGMVVGILDVVKPLHLPLGSSRNRCWDNISLWDQSCPSSLSNTSFLSCSTSGGRSS